MTPQTQDYYLMITRGGAEISAAEYSVISRVSYVQDYLNKGNEKSVNISYVLGDQTPAGFDTFYSLMNTYIFSSAGPSQNNTQDEYTIAIGRNAAEARNNVFYGCVFSVNPQFPEDGNIAFNATLMNQANGNAETSADILRANTWQPNTSAYDVLSESVQALNKTLVANPADMAALQNIIHLDGISRPVHQTTANWLNELANDYGIYLHDQGATMNVVSLNLTTPANIYYVYRPTSADQADLPICISFTPDLTKPPKLLGTGVGTSSTDGSTVAQGSGSTPGGSTSGSNVYQFKDVAKPAQTSAGSNVNIAGPGSVFNTPTAPASAPINEITVPT